MNSNDHFGLGSCQANLTSILSLSRRAQFRFRFRSFELVGEVLNINVLRNNNEEGLLGVAFHPDFEQNGRAFVHYSASNPRRSVIAEYQRSTNERLKLDATTERILMEIEQPFGNHNGGDLRFGPDGYLYIALGDGGSAGDPLYHGQNRESRLGTILRIDIDRPDEACNTPYGIPDDNPFAPERCMPGQENDDAPEIYAWGFRNVWRMSFDRSSGALYAADVGQDMFEEVNRVKLGGNYGWNQTEGHVCFTEPCDTSLFEAPLLTYSRQVGRSITGGFVYRGSRWPSLWGQYVFGDFESGKIWSIDPDAVDPEQTLLVDSGERITSFGENSAGEIFVVTFDSGVLTFDAPSHSSASPPLPPTLLETGCFANVATYQLHPSVIPYSVNSPLWSDGLLKERHVALPVDTKAKVEANGLIALPVGSVVLKTFYSIVDGEKKRIETRINRRGPDRWNGYTYIWRADQQNADLATTGRILNVNVDGEQVEWQVPSRAECDQCHIERMGYSLGLDVRQLKRAHDYDGIIAPQLSTWYAGGLLDGIDETANITAFPAPDDETVDLGARTRAMLHANCAMCHRPDGPADADIDLRASTPLAEMGVCNQLPKRGEVDVQDGRLLIPGNSGYSLLLRRMQIREKGAMPPLGSSRTDVSGTSLLSRWINSLESCGEPAP